MKKLPKFATKLQRDAYFLGVRHAEEGRTVDISSLPSVLQLYYVLGGLDAS